MVNIGFVVIVFSNIISITYGGILDGLSSVGSSVAAVTNGLTGDLLPFVSKITYNTRLQSILLPVVGNVGSIAIPFKSICAVPGVNDYLFCYLCNQDCWVAHNKYGGKCGIVPGTSESKCICANSAEEAARRNISTSSKDTCAGYLLPKLPYIIAALDDEVARFILRFRLGIGLCPKNTKGAYISYGCNTDCQANHNLEGGKCCDTKPNNAVFGTAKTTFCECH